jgi:hypothetical protein
VSRVGGRRGSVLVSLDSTHIGDEAAQQVIGVPSGTSLVESLLGGAEIPEVVRQ